MMPAVTVPPSPNGLPTASTHCPTFGCRCAKVTYLKPVAVDLQKRDVGALVLADQLGVELAPVVHQHGVLGAVGDDVRVGDEIAVLADEEAGALAQPVARMKRLAAVTAVVAVVAGHVRHPEAAEEFLHARRKICRSLASSRGRRRRRFRS